MLLLLERLEQTIYDAAIQDSVESLSPSSCSRCLPEFDHGERVVLVVKECLGSYPFRSLCPWGEGGELGWVFVGGHPIHHIAMYCTAFNPPIHCTTCSIALNSIALHRLRTFNPWEGRMKRVWRATRGQMRAVSPNKVNLAASSGAHCCLGKPRWEPGCLSLFQ